MKQATDTLVQATAAGAAAVITALTLYPLDVVKTRLNAGVDEDGVPYDGPTDVVKRQFKKHGYWKGFYSGVEVKLLQDVVRSVSFFYVFVTMKKAYTRRYGKIGVQMNLLLGYLSAVVNLLVTMPVEVVNTRIMTGTSRGSMAAVLRELMAGGGISQLYTGLRANFILCLNPAIKHMVFDQVKARLLKGDSTTLGPAKSFLLGGLSTVISSTTTFPATRARALMQSAKLPNGKGRGLPLGMEVAGKSVFEVVCMIHNRGGLMALYKGLGPQLTRGVLASALLLSTKESIHHHAARWVKYASVVLKSLSLIVLLLLTPRRKSKHLPAPPRAG
mmetsp:Transcript_58948/g.120691  ORF Transcript_58948/g.120691 Transcript_58948/m.120691 type:complete len:331 (-) Transcript_58948:167-1159(-)|eukprot:CAMPEP_0181309354 /NCGR_PEP_ID=MMETSP1101-20121128/11967_1 /TAXON_ID=46948 /ORGANISM="Rhodomonas abbreviata, Strain Caron Lab Isolate" /LENGTH=330 /DNA_ID=CAMNT_0023415829 /DNA_START=188 /DNA_END=1180 /DNA_ORIENTATION=-